MFPKLIFTFFLSICDDISSSLQRGVWCRQDREHQEGDLLLRDGRGQGGQEEGLLQGLAGGPDCPDQPPSGGLWQR